MSANEENETEQGKKGKGKSDAEYTPPPLPDEPEAPKSFLPSVNFVQTLRKATPYVPPSTAETRSKVFSKLSAAEELPTAGASEEAAPSMPKENQELKVALPPKTLAGPDPEVKKPAPPAETPRIIIKPIKGPPARVGKPPAEIKPVTLVPVPPQPAPEKELPGPAMPDAAIFAENPWEPAKEQKKGPEAIRIQSPWGKTPAVKSLQARPLPPPPEEQPAAKLVEARPTPPAVVEEPAKEVKKFDWKAIQAQSDVLWNYIGQLLDWLEAMVAKADQIKKSVVIERVYTIRNKIEQNFGITFPDMETEKLPNVDILRIGIEYVKYLKENFKPDYFLCPTCNHILAFYYPVGEIPCPTCGSKLEPTSPSS